MSLPLYRPRKSSLFLSILLVLLSSATAQKMAVPSANTQKSDEKMTYVPPESVSKSRDAYSRAAKDWAEKRDKDLVRDIGKPRDEMVSRITAEQERTAKMLLGRKAYYESLGKYYDTLGERISATGQVDIDHQKVITQQGIMMLVDQRQQLEKEIADAKVQSIQNQLREQLKNIEQAKKTLEDDALSLDRIKQSDAAIELSRASAAKAQKNLASTMKSIAQSTDELNLLYASQFKALKTVAGTPVPVIPEKQEKQPKTVEVAVPPPPLPPPPPQPQPQTRVEEGVPSGKNQVPVSQPEVVPTTADKVNLTGVWKFRGTDRLSGPGLVIVEISDAPEGIKGSLTMSNQPKSWGASTIECNFSGPRTLKGDPGAYTFACSTSTRPGELHLLPNAMKPNLLEVVWKSKGTRDIQFDQQLVK